MHSEKRDVAILFFSRSAEAEGASKQFVCDKNREDKNVSIARSLIKHTRKQLNQTRLPVYEFGEKVQQGTSFGEKFANAFTQAFNEGYEYVIAVGNDTPELTSAHITEAEQLLTEEQKQIVLGPAEDGGTWLMGYSREAFEACSFEHLPWNSNRLLTTILVQNGGNTSVALLEPFADIDDYNTLINFVNQFKYYSSSLSVLAGLILHILSDDQAEPNFRRHLTPFSPAFSSLSLRAPPLMS